MNPQTNLVTSCVFRGKEYLVNLRMLKEHSEYIEVRVTDKKTAEEWLGSFNASYIENLTHKTGNYKRFDTFISMLRSGLLGTSHCLTLDLLTFDDLELLRSRNSHGRRFPTQNSHISTSSTNQRRYLILTYTVEFDRIHYPLALEYCGPPDPRILQETIQRLEKQVADLQFQLDHNDWGHIKHEIEALQKKVIDVTSENIMLKKQIQNVTELQKNKLINRDTDSLLKHLKNLEDKLKFERNCKDDLLKENIQLKSLLNEALKTEKRLKAHVSVFPAEEPMNLREEKQPKNFGSISPKRTLFTISGNDKSFRRQRKLSGERRVCSARSCVNLIHSSSEESIGGGKRRCKKDFKLPTPPRSRASSPSLSDLSHNSEISRCACRNCLRSKLPKKENQSRNIKNRDKDSGKAKLLKRIQSLEKVISGLLINES